MQPSPALEHEQAVAGDPIKPCGKALLSMQGIQVPECVEERLLSQVGGQLRIARAGGEVAHEGLVIAVDQHCEGVCVGTGDGHRLAIGQLGRRGAQAMSPYSRLGILLPS